MDALTMAVPIIMLSPLVVIMAIVFYGMCKANKKLAGGLALCVALSLFLSMCAYAEENGLWLTSGVRSYHNDRSHGYNEHNVGAGLEIRLNNTHSIYAGYYQNSINRRTDYVGYTWQPISYGGFHAGLFGVVATGYTSRGKGEIVAPVPMMTYDWRYVGINVIAIPYVVTAVQLKVKLL